MEDLLREAIRLRLDGEGGGGDLASAAQAVASVLLAAIYDALDAFTRGDVILPRMLRSAEVAHRAREYLRSLEPGLQPRGRVVVATVAGDVHDIGASLLKAVLKSTGYAVLDLGKQVSVARIVVAAQEPGVDAVALSALLASSSRQMPLVVQGLDSRGVSVPVLLGGAALNRSFGWRSAVLPDGRVYDPGVFYCRDVFEGLEVLDDLATSEPRRDARIRQRREEIQQERTREVPVAAPRPARGGGPDRVRDARVPSVPSWGARRIEVPLREVWEHLDRGTLYRFHWGGYRLDADALDRLQREEFEPLLGRLKLEAEEAGWIQALVVSGYFPCNAEGDDLVVFDPAHQDTQVARLVFPRQPDGDRLCLADYFRPLESGIRDVVAFQAVSAGGGAARYVEQLERAGSYERMVYVHGLAAATAEALASWAHEHARREMGLAPGQGLRYSWGYPACPDLEEQRKVLPLLRADEEIGLRLSASGSLDPEHSTAALVVHHPHASYFAVRPIGETS